MTQIRQRDNRSYNNNLSLADNKYNIHVNSPVCSMCMAIKEKVNLIIADFCEPIITNFLSLLLNTTQWFQITKNLPQNKFTWCDFTSFSKPNFSKFTSVFRFRGWVLFSKFFKTITEEDEWKITQTKNPILYVLLAKRAGTQHFYL